MFTGSPGLYIKKKIKMIKKINRTLFELMLGIISYGILAFIVLGIIYFVLNILSVPVPLVWNAGRMFIGLAAGVIAALLASIHMWWALDRSLSLDEKAASGKIIRNYSVRYVFYIVVLTVFSMTGIANPVAVFIGLLGIKAGAYLNRFMKYFSDKIYGVEIPYDGTDEAVDNEEK